MLNAEQAESLRKARNHMLNAYRQLEKLEAMTTGDANEQAFMVGYSLQGVMDRASELHNS